MKIIIPVLGMGRAGGERVLSKIATELVKQGNDVFFVTPKLDSPPYYSTDAEIIFCERSKNKIKVMRFIKNLYNIWRECKKLNGDVIVANHHITAYVSIFLLSKKQRFYYVQAYEVNFSKNIVRKLIAFITYLLPLNKIVNNDKLLPKILNKHLAIIPAGIDYELFYDSKIPMIDGKISIGIIGRKEPYKGTKEVLRVLYKFIEKNKLEDRITVNVAVHLPEIKNSIKNIHYYPIENDIELAQFYKLNDIFIATGLLEDGGFHYPCAEAMTAGCLVISNYAPLTETSSELSVHTFSDNAIKFALDKCLKMNEIDVKQQVLINQSFMKNLSWSIIGLQMNNALKIVD